MTHFFLESEKLGNNFITCIPLVPSKISVVCLLLVSSIHCMLFSPGIVNVGISDDFTSLALGSRSVVIGVYWLLVWVTVSKFSRIAEK